ncbi:hypothetical protein Pmani_010288 [Petrolisthes manimaculis]|uniref:RRM domain-containing protein n=1 Tax=Petrolisthes manimaculis TaxID=1843537 RepID=A0AAE1Q310_9EUCA|nr:hypothetical protein Pmani_010288 [Petrolisthes manimaculis]
MASVTNSNAKRYRFLGQEEEIPNFHAVDTLREKILKCLVEKQLTKSTSLNEQLEKSKIFIKSTSEVSISANTCGLSSCQEYKELETSLNTKQILYSCGLSPAETELLLNEGSSSSLEAPHAKQKRLKEIEKKLLSRQHQLEELTHSPPDQFSGALPLNRHQYEEECSFLSSLTNTEKPTPCLVRLQPHCDPTIPHNHPLNHLKDIADELFSKDTALESKVNSCATNFKQKVTELVGSSLKRKKVREQNCIYLTEKPKSFWDLKDIPKIIKREQVNKTKRDIGIISAKKVESPIRKEIFSRSSTCNGNAVINQTRPFVLTLDPNELIPLDVIKSNRKTVQELLAMDKFKSYSKGSPSFTLYVKNLSHDASPKDLASLMGHFECEGGTKIQYRILNGRMKGQAFIMFPDKEMASRALNICNGYILNNKPLVIEFGKSKSNNCCD